jgi:hypothetical protein
LPRIGDVAVHAAAARRIYEPATIRRRLLDLHRLAVYNTSGDALDARPHPLTGNRAADERDPAVQPRDHAPAGGGFFDGKGDDLSGSDHPPAGPT